MPTGFGAYDPAMIKRQNFFFEDQYKDFEDIYKLNEKTGPVVFINFL